MENLLSKPQNISVRLEIFDISKNGKICLIYYQVKKAKNKTVMSVISML